MTTFLKGKFLSIWNKQLEVWDNARETLVAVDDIKRIKACVVHVHDPKTKKDIGTRNALVISAKCRIDDCDREVDCYELTDPIPVIAKAIHRDPDELSALLLELELKE